MFWFRGSKQELMNIYFTIYLFLILFRVSWRFKRAEQASSRSEVGNQAFCSARDVLAAESFLPFCVQSFLGLDLRVRGWGGNGTGRQERSN